MQTFGRVICQSQIILVAPPIGGWKIWANMCGDLWNSLSGEIIWLILPIVQQMCIMQGSSILHNMDDLDLLPQGHLEITFEEMIFLWWSLYLYKWTNIHIPLQDYYTDKSLWFVVHHGGATHGFPWNYYHRYQNTLNSVFRLWIKLGLQNLHQICVGSRDKFW